MQGLVDLWVMGIYLAWFIYTKSMLRFMAIYITRDLSLNYGDLKNSP